MKSFMKIFIVLIIFSTIFINFSSKNIAYAHDGVRHSIEKTFVCNETKVTFLKYYLFKLFNHRAFLKCEIVRKIVDHDENPSSSPSLSPTPSNTPSAIPSALPTGTPSPKPQPTSNVSTTSINPNQYWHAPGSHDGLNVHEHGDKAPTWADEFSQKNFGHPVMFGGDEATPGENSLKHQAYKGFIMTASGVEIFIRYHSMSAPHDRMGAFHSYEVYSKDKSNNISFWQGHIFHGYPNILSQRMPRHGEQPGFDPIYNITWPGRSQFIISGSDLADWKDYKRCEQWYGHAGLWSWDLSITICGATTYFTPNEHLGDVFNQSTWHPTGDKGGSRRLEVSHYGPETPNINGEKLPFDKWFCVKKTPNENKSTGDTPTWDVGGSVSGPTACPDGWLPQFVAGTFPKTGVYFKTGNTAEKDFPTPGVTIPN